MKIQAFFAYLKERFPPVNMALFAILFGTVYSVAAFFNTSPASAVRFGWQEGLGIMATISFFFRLRVFDEIKDYSIDALNHPYRVLQSGKITLRQLKSVSLLGSLLEILWSVLMGVPTLAAWFTAFLYSLLMRYEFFISGYLKKKLLVYAFSHMLIMPLIILWIWSAFVPGPGLSIPLGMLSLLSLLGGFSFEIARKIHVPEAEKKTIDSYSKTMGYRAAIITVLVLLLAGVAVQGYLLVLLQSGALPFVCIGLLYGLTVLIYLFSLIRPHEKNLKRAELLVSLFMLVSYISVIAVVQGRMFSR